ncbi:MAG: hypothetical protein Q4D05_09495 [Acinetobacter sp.]|nr:hypothetical protein [Acinetobacter sp.]
MNDLDKELKMAEINKLNAEAAKIQAEAQATMLQANAEISKMMAETAKINKETKYYPLVFLLTGMAGGIIVAIIQMLSK